MNDATTGTTWDCLIIGAGPAGLAAATYLCRYRRSVCVIDSGDSRAAHIPESHNMPGFPEGISGLGLLQRMRAHAEGAGTVVTKGCVDALRRDEDLFIAQAGDAQLRARAVLIATGMTDDAALPGLPPQATWNGIVRWCPICDGYESLDKRIVLIGEWVHGPAHALFMRTYTRSLTLVLPPGNTAGREQRQALDEAGITLIEATPRRASFGSEGGALHFDDRADLTFDVLYPMTGAQPHSDLAMSVGAGCDEHGALLVDEHQQTTVPGLYAAGDVVASLRQISVAVAEGALAASGIHRRLPPNFR